MTIPRFSSLLIMLALGREASALQMGQMTSQSLRGQPLLARVSLYGMSSVAAGDVRAELLPAFGANDDSLAAFDVHARIETNESGEQAIVISSARAFEASNLTLRVRLHEGARAMVRHFALNIPAAPVGRTANSTRPAHTAPTRRAPRAVAVDDNTVVSPALTAMTEDYGPVRAGQSLWGILKETGLAAADSRQLMKDIVAANPQAFVGGDATRLRVGVVLRLPRHAGLARTASTTPTAQAAGQAIDAETAARLERLATRFAQIRARYAAQQRQAATAAVTVPQATPFAPPAETAKVVTSPSATSEVKQPVAASTAAASPAKVIKPRVKTVASAPRAEADSPMEALARYVDGRILMGLGAVLLAAALLLGGQGLGRRLRSRMAEAGVRSADREMVAEIARKTEKRAQLEDEVKRMMAGRRDGTGESASGGLRPADMLSGVRASLDEIETRIAHGQYNEAEAMLEQTIAETPNNFRAKMRLAEIYYLNERHEEFVDLADEIHRQHRRDIGDENWARLMRMGKVIAPDRPPFSGPVAVETERHAS